jgi:hypothetical protein
MKPVTPKQGENLAWAPSDPANDPTTKKGKIETLSSSRSDIDPNKFDKNRRLSSDPITDSNLPVYADREIGETPEAARGWLRAR